MVSRCRGHCRSVNTWTGLYRSWDGWAPPAGEVADLYHEAHRRIRADQRFAVAYAGIDALGELREARPLGHDRVVATLSGILREEMPERCHAAAESSSSAPIGGASHDRPTRFHLTAVCRGPPAQADRSAALLARYESSNSVLFQNSDLNACLYSLSFSRALTSTA